MDVISKSDGVKGESHIIQEISSPLPEGRKEGGILARIDESEDASAKLELQFIQGIAGNASPLRVAHRSGWFGGEGVPNRA